jgi:hypothetical protein
MEECKIKESIYNKSYYKTYKEAFSLMQPLNIETTPITLLIKAMSQLSAKVELGYFIAKQSIKINTLEFMTDEVKLKASIEKARQTHSIDYLISSCEISTSSKRLIELKTTLIRKKDDVRREKFNNKETSYIGNINKEIFRTITKDEVCKFSNISGDPNYIHKGEKPIVQAMLILLLLEDYLALKEIYMYSCEIIYMNPIPADSDIFLCWQDCKKLLGIVKNEICFKLIFK